MFFAMEFSYNFEANEVDKSHKVPKKFIKDFTRHGAKSSFYPLKYLKFRENRFLKRVKLNVSRIRRVLASS